MCKANSFFIGSSANIKIMVAERKRVRGLVSTPAHPKVSLSRPTATGGNEEMLTQNYSSEEIILMWSKKPVRDDRLAMWPAGKE